MDYIMSNRIEENKTSVAPIYKDYSRNEKGDVVACEAVVVISDDKGSGAHDSFPVKDTRGPSGSFGSAGGSQLRRLGAGPHLTYMCFRHPDHASMFFFDNCMP